MNITLNALSKYMFDMFLAFKRIELCLFKVFNIFKFTPVNLLKIGQKNLS
jgi:hypothetical protein